MSKVTLFIATTLDGKIARKKSELDWLMNRPNPNQLDFGCVSTPKKQTVEK